MQSLYIHIPFCTKKCAYCDFYSISYAQNLAESYINTIIKQIKALEFDFNTVYIGGGTPTVLDDALIKKLLMSVAAVSRKTMEYTIEANPDSLTKDKLKILFDCGVNRLSVGIQSSNDMKLKKLGRIHSARKAIESVCLAEKTGFTNISIDLIFGIYQETFKEWKKDIETAAELPVKHISVYSLTYEKHTPLFTLLKKGEISELDDAIAKEMYEYAMSYLSQKKYLHYEISNFAKKGYECKHNLNYWHNDSYIGLGASAVSYRNGERYEYASDVKEYIRIVSGKSSPIIFKEKLSAEKSAGETAAIKIRTREGIDCKWFKNKTGFDIFKLKKNVLNSLVKQGLLCYVESKEKKRIQLTRQGVLFCDFVSEQLV